MKLTTAGIAAARSALASRPWSPRAQMFPPCCRGPLEEREGWSLARLLLARIQRGGCTESGNILPVFLWVNVTHGVVAHFTVSISLSNVWLCGGEKATAVMASLHLPWNLMDTHINGSTCCYNACVCVPWGGTRLQVSDS